LLDQPSRQADTLWAVDPAKVHVVIPVLNAGSHLEALLPSLAAQGLARDHILVMDSESTDHSWAAFEEFGARVVRVPRGTFNHGGTRQRAVEMLPDAEIVVMLTQDAIPQQPDTIRNLIAAFADPRVGMAYGRQLPRQGARGIERHARLTNYPPASETRTFDDRHRIGIKTVFCSDSFAAYRTSALSAVGGFPEDAFFAEDQLVAGQMLIQGWALAYRADAEVEHSHGYTVVEEFRRYFDVGVFHGRNRWLTQTFGRAEGEGLRFIRSELSYLVRNDPVQLPSVIVRTLAKYAGYKMGCREDRLSRHWKQRLSMQPFYWRQQHG
jgi:rhamnosyltransferase